MSHLGLNVTCLANSIKPSYLRYAFVIFLLINAVIMLVKIL